MRRAVTSFAAALLLVVFSGALLAATSAADAASVSRSGWWTRNPAATAPETGFEVSTAPDGPVSVAAVEITATGGVSDAVITLHESGGLQQDTAKLQVCTSPNQWKPGAAQAWADAPKAECSKGSAELTRNAAAATWAADVSSLLGDIAEKGAVTLMVVPAEPAAGGVPPAFEVDIDKVEVRAESAGASSGSAFPTGYAGSGSDSDTSAASTSSGENSSSTGKDMSELSGVASSPSYSAPLTSSPVAPTTADGATGAAIDPPAVDTPAPAAPSGPTELAAVPTQASAGVATAGGNATVQALFFVAVATIAGGAAGGGRWFLRRRTADPGPLA